MQKVFKTINKKVNLRRLSAVWLLLIAIELFCPALCEALIFTPGDNQPPSVFNLTVGSLKESDSYITTCEHQGQSHGQQLVCHDECLCHATAIPNLGFLNHKDAIAKSDSIAFNFSNPLHNFLPPPDNPPKLS